MGKHGFSLDEIAGILDISHRLVEAYVDIVEEHHPTTIADNPHLQQQATDPSSTAALGAT